MLDSSKIKSLPRMAAPLLTVYLNTNPAVLRNQASQPGYLTQLKTRSKELEKNLPAGERAAFRAQVERVQSFLATHPPHHQSAVIFAGRKVWEALRLQVPARDEIHWGRPALAQLLWLLDEHRPHGGVVLSHSGARLFRMRLGEIDEQPREEFAPETTAWRMKYIMPPSQPGMRKTRGSEHDRFEQRIEEQLSHFLRRLAKKIALWAEREKLSPLILAGPAALADHFRDELPDALRQRTLVRHCDLWKLSVPEIHSRFQSQVNSWERKRELEQVEALLAAANSARAASGVRGTIRSLQQGRARQLFVVRGLEGTVLQCEKCRQVAENGNRHCDKCGEHQKKTSLREIVPELAHRLGVPVEIVDGVAAEKLRRAGGLGAWLQPRNRKAVA